MLEKEIIIPAGAEISTGEHEDGESYIFEKDLKAMVIEVMTNTGSLRVIVPSIDSDRVFFYHQPEKKKTD